VNDNLPISYLDEPYEVFLQASGGIPPYQWSVQSELLWIVASEQTAGQWYLSGTPDSPTPLTGTDVTIFVTDSSYADGKTEQKTLKLVTNECEENERRNCFVPEGEVCMNGSQRCVGDTWEQCYASQGPSTDIDHCGGNCEPCDLAKSESCNNGTCACGNGSPCPGSQICCYGKCYDAPACGDCGNEIRDGIEECDKDDFGGESCQTLGYYGGQLKCDENCRYDLIECMIAGKCGDNSRNGPEECDGTDLASGNCEQLSYLSGDLECANNCVYDYSNCCGDGTTGSTEQCDDVNSDTWDGCDDCLINDFFLETSTEAQSHPSIAVDESGKFVIVWEGNIPNDLDNVISGLRFNQQGIPIGGDFRIDMSPDGNQRDPDIAMTPQGNFVVVWSGKSRSGTDSEIFGRIYDATGNPIGDEFQVNTYTINSQQAPSVAIAPTGDFIVVWESFGDQDGSASGIYGQRYNSAGLPQGDEFRINTSVANAQVDPDVAIDSTGRFFVVWTSSHLDFTQGDIFYQRFDCDGTPIGNEIQINTHTENSQTNPSIAFSSDGSAVVVWDSDGQDGSGSGVYAQLYDNTGSPLGSEFQVNSYTISNQILSSVSRNGSGEFVVLWTSEGQDGWAFGIFGQRFNSDGARIGGEFQVNIYFEDWQVEPKIALDPDGNFFAAWMGIAPPGTGSGWVVLCQRYNNGNLPRGREPW
jgi:hypothetical protein